MRKILLVQFALLALLAFPVQAQPYDTNSIEYVIKKVPNNDPKEFWMTLYYNHPQNIAMRRAIDKNKASIVQTINSFPRKENIRKYLEFEMEQEAINSDKANELIAKLKEITQVDNSFTDIKFYVAPGNAPNACMYMDGTCVINSYWIDSDTKIEELVAICCHEIAHYALSHVIRNAWSKSKAAKRNAVWAEIGTGVAMGAYAASQMYSAQYGVSQSNSAQQQMYENLAKAGANAYYEGQWIAEFRQKYKYKRESETEADEVAFWFMEKNGIDPIHLINVFKRLEMYSPTLMKEARKTADHPEMKKRVKHLEAMYKIHHKKKRK